VQLGIRDPKDETEKALMYEPLWPKKNKQLKR
jgi:hypothetical protein